MRASKEARARQRWREQVARPVAESMTEHWHAITRPLEVAGLAHSLLGGMHFDVALARSYAERLIAEGERLERERLVFMDWTRERGLGLENREPSAFVPACTLCRRLPGSGGIGPCYGCNGYPEQSGGWPGPLAREWGTVRCEACDGHGRVKPAFDTQPGDSPAVALEHKPQRRKLIKAVTERCNPCKGRGYVKRHGREAAAATGGAWMIRAGRRLLAALEGQPSECDACEGRGRAVILSPDGSNDDGDCMGCRGTGHNLSGALPRVEWSPSLRRKLADMPEPVIPGRLDDWIGRLIQAGGETLLDARDTPLRTTLDDLAHEARPLANLVRVERAVANGLRPHPVKWTVEREETRVVPRGEHRADLNLLVGRRLEGPATVHVYEPPLTEGQYGPRQRIVTTRHLLPRWRRGELRHSEQRRERERRVSGDVAHARAAG